LDVFCTVIDIISVCGSIPIEIPILWPRAVMVGSSPAYSQRRLCVQVVTVGGAHNEQPEYKS
jgi:hypothetical protein